MCDCKNNAELVMVYGILKTYRCIECGKEWEENVEKNGKKMWKRMGRKCGKEWEEKDSHSIEE